MSDSNSTITLSDNNICLTSSNDTMLGCYTSPTDLTSLTTPDFNNMISIGTLTTDWNTTGVGNLTIGGSLIYGDSIYNPVHNGNGLHVQGNAEINGSLKVNGVDIVETLGKITERLAILKPNPELESRWERLKALADEYRALEKDILEQEQVYEILKK